MNFQRFLEDPSQLAFGPQYHISKVDLFYIYKVWLENRATKSTASVAAVDSAPNLLTLVVDHGITLDYGTRRDPLHCLLKEAETTWIVGCTAADFVPEMKRILHWDDKPLTGSAPPPPSPPPPTPTPPTLPPLTRASIPSTRSVGSSIPATPSVALPGPSRAGCASPSCGCLPVGALDPSAACGHCSLHFVLRHFSHADKSIGERVRELVKETQPMYGAMYPVQIVHALSEPQWNLSATLYHTVGNVRNLRQGQRNESEIADNDLDLIRDQQKRQQKPTTIADAAADAAAAAVAAVDTKDNSNTIGGKEGDSLSEEVNELRTRLNAVEARLAVRKRLSTAQLRRMLTGGDTLVILTVDSRFLPYQNKAFKKSKSYQGHFIVVHRYDILTNRFEIQDSCFPRFQHVTERQLNATRSRSAMWNARAAIVVQPRPPLLPLTDATTTATSTTALTTPLKKKRRRTTLVGPTRFSRRLSHHKILYF